MARLSMILVCLTAQGCLSNPFGTDADVSDDARLRPIPRYEPVAGAPTGVVPLGIGSPRDGLLFVPPGYDPAVATPLVVLLHGAGGDAASMLATHQDVADTLGVILLSLDSRAYTWDRIVARFDYDISFIDSAFTSVAARYNIDHSRIALAGFSDGATYALALGRANGSIFRRVAAHAPGVLFPVRNHGRASFYIAHGHQDPILPFEITQDIIAPSLRVMRFPVRLVEFDGGHVMRRINISESMRWFIE